MRGVQSRIDPELKKIIKELRDMMQKEPQIKKVSNRVASKRLAELLREMGIPQMVEIKPGKKCKKYQIGL